MEENDQIEYEAEISRRLKRWFRMNRSRLFIVSMFSVIGYILLYIILYFANGKGFAIENIWMTIITLIAVEGMGFLGYVFWLAYRKIPQEIDNDKNKRIKELLVSVVDRETKEIRQFYTLSRHAECIVKNSNAEPVAKYLMQKWTEIPSSVTNEQTVYMIDRFQYFDPKTHNTLQYAIVASGIKEIMGARPASKVAGLNLYPVLSASVIELFTITISQGGEGTSRVTFDTDIAAMDEDYSEFVFKDLKEVFKIGRIKRH